MNDREFRQPNEINDGKSKAKIFFKQVGIIALAIVLAVLTVFVINLNR